MVAYASKALSSAERNYSATERELLALLFAAEHFRPFIYGKKWTAITDHKALETLKVQHNPSARLVRWLLKLQELDCTIQHRPGKLNNAPDLMTRDTTEALAASAEEEKLKPPVAVSAVSTRSKSRAEVAPAGTAGTEEEAEVSAEVPRAVAEDPPLAVPEHVAAPAEPAPADRSIQDASAFAVAQREDPELQPMFDFLLEKRLPADRDAAASIRSEAEQFTVDVERGGLLLHFASEPRRQVEERSLQLVVPASLRSQVFHENHSSALAGHLGTVKTIARVRERYWWRGMNADLTKSVATCKECCERKGRAAHNGLLQPIDGGDWLSTIACDYMGPFKSTDKGNHFIFVVMVYSTRYAFAFPTQRADAKSAADCLLYGVFSRIGAAQRLLSDRGQHFLALIVKELCAVFKVAKVYTSPYHPQCDGLVERFNSTLQEMLSKFVNQRQTDWDVMLPLVTFAYNTSVQKSLGDSPHFLMFGRDALLPSSTPTEHLRLSSAAKGHDVFAYREQLVARLELARKLAKECLASAQEKQKAYFDSTHREHPFAVGQAVWMHVPQIKAGLSRKLSRCWTGPFRIIWLSDSLARLRNVASGVTLRSKIHVRRLKPFVPAHSKPVVDLSAPEDVPGEDEPDEVEEAEGAFDEAAEIIVTE